MSPDEAVAARLAEAEVLLRRVLKEGVRPIPLRLWDDIDEFFDEADADQEER